MTAPPTGTASTADPAGITVSRPLSQLAAGETATICGHCGTPDDCELLIAMGLEMGCTIHVRRKGEPCIVQVQSTRVGLSRSVSDQILVTAEAVGV
jgi:Fe2+ transport system protein FeoA